MRLSAHVYDSVALVGDQYDITPLGWRIIVEWFARRGIGAELLRSAAGPYAVRTGRELTPAEWSALLAVLCTDEHCRPPREVGAEA